MENLNMNKYIIESGNQDYFLNTKNNIEWITFAGELPKFPHKKFSTLKAAKLGLSQIKNYHGDKLRIFRCY